MKYSIYIILSIILFQVSCVEDPWDEVEKEGWNNERRVLDIQFENQVGLAEISRVDDVTGDIHFTINAYAVDDLSAVKLKSITLSYEGTSSVQTGEALNFENEDNSATFTVTSPTGKTRQYTVVAEPFVEELVGTWDITNLVVLGGTGPEWGGGAVIPMTNKPWIWPEEGGPEAELDNTLTFTLDSISADGNTIGTIINDAGEDGAYADFIYIKDPVTDVNNFYRTIPKGVGTWVRNYSTGTVTISWGDKAFVGELVASGTETFNWNNGYSHTKTTTDNALAFDLQGNDDWDNIYSDYDKFVKRPRRYWIDITKL